eukprot:2413013-Amphidinium_carterae.1
MAASISFDGSGGAGSSHSAPCDTTKRVSANNESSCFDLASTRRMATRPIDFHISRETKCLTSTTPDASQAPEALSSSSQRSG